MTGADPSTGSEGEGVAYAGAYVCLVIPGLVIATVGGGTQLATQRECLSMLGCYGKVCDQLNISNNKICCEHKLIKL